jgi:hypothetical protein
MVDIADSDMLDRKRAAIVEQEELDVLGEPGPSEDQRKPRSLVIISRRDP